MNFTNTFGFDLVDEIEELAMMMMDNEY